jgi:hypothetical protein
MKRSIQFEYIRSRLTIFALKHIFEQCPTGQTMTRRRKTPSNSTTQVKNERTSRWIRRVFKRCPAREAPGEYGRLSKSPMFFEVIEANETEDFYEVTLSFRPQGEFTGTPGQEIFFIGKDGQLEHRQVKSLPYEERSGNSRRVGLLVTVFMVIVIAGVVGAAIAFGGFRDDTGVHAAPASAPNIPAPEAPTPIQIAPVIQPSGVAPPIGPSPTPQITAPPIILAPTETPLPALTTTPTQPALTTVPTNTVTPAPTHTPTATQAATPIHTPTATQTAIPTRVPTRTATPAPTAFPTATPPLALYTLSVATLPEAAMSGGVLVSGFGLYTSGTSVEVTATDRTECRNNVIYQFSRWERVDGDPNTLTSFVVMDRSREAVAVYEVINCATPTPTPLPNLRPGAPEGWDAPLVLTLKRSDFLEVPRAAETSFKEGDTVYANWAVLNESKRSINTPFEVALQVDGTVVQSFSVPRLSIGEYARLLNIPLQISGFGDHEITLVVDSNANIAELDESENSYSASVALTSRFSIAFYSDRNGRNDIYVMNADGSEQTRLTNGLFPAWSPDGSRIAFRSFRNGSTDIYVMKPDGSRQTRLTNINGSDSNPAWSLDGSMIAFDSNRDGNEDVYVISADGSGQTRLTNNAATDRGPTWSPDGSMISFYSYRDGSVEIYVMNTDGSGQTRLTNDDIGGRDPAWSPDGTKIAFYSPRDAEIYVMNADGSGQTRLTNNDARDVSPAWWSPR